MALYRAGSAFSAAAATCIDARTLVFRDLKFLQNWAVRCSPDIDDAPYMGP